MYSPHPEEINRVLAGQLGELHFAPTKQCEANLLADGIKKNNIFITGNTVIDALLEISKQDFPVPVELTHADKLILVTAHRRENFGANLVSICTAIKKIVERFPQVKILFPVHPNPNVQDTVFSILNNTKNICLCEPLDYGSFITAMKKSHIILSDSGGVQEEAPALGVPVLVLRDKTERPESLACGASKLVGADLDLIVSETEKLLTDKHYYQSMVIGSSPYGDGTAAKQIVSIINNYFS